MTLRSKFNKGNIIVVYDTQSKSRRALKVASVESWDRFNGFSYQFREVDDTFGIYEKYCDLDFEMQFDIKKIFVDEIDYKRWKK